MDVLFSLRYTILFLCLLGFSCNKVGDKEAIHDVWNEYCISLASRDGRSAVNLIDKETIMYYDWIARFIRHEDSSAIKKHFLSEEIMILSMRRTIPRDSLMMMGGRDLIQMLVERDMYGEGFHKTKLSNLVVKGPKAKALLVVDTTKDYSYQIDFIKEDGAWKIAFMPLLNNLYPKLESYFQKHLFEQNLSEEELLMRAVNDDSALPSSIWRPLLIDSFYLKDN